MLVLKAKARICRALMFEGVEKMEIPLSSWLEPILRALAEMHIYTILEYLNQPAHVVDRLYKSPAARVPTYRQLYTIFHRGVSIGLVG